MPRARSNGIELEYETLGDQARISDRRGGTVPAGDGEVRPRLPAADALVDVSGGHATAAAIPGAGLVLIPGMGHNLPEDAWPPIIDAIVRNTKA